MRHWVETGPAGHARGPAAFVAVRMWLELDLGAYPKTPWKRRPAASSGGTPHFPSGGTPLLRAHRRVLQHAIVRRPDSFRPPLRRRGFRRNSLPPACFARRAAAGGRALPLEKVLHNAYYATHRTRVRRPFCQCPLLIFCPLFITATSWKARRARAARLAPQSIFSRSRWNVFDTLFPPRRRMHSSKAVESSSAQPSPLPPSCRR